MKTALTSWRGENLLERVEVEPVVAVADADHARARRAQRRQRAGERRRLDHDDVARVEQRARGEVDALARAGRDDDLVGVVGEAVLAAAQRELLA